ncbi:MAG: choice-of-anchor M domain-containing protein [Armatimonadetes bacterium]|nr:choice-of-anchor M domain-containing protein [Armatimonadota bacterium]
MQNHKCKLLALALLLSLGKAQAFSTVLTEGHTDVGVGYGSGALGMEVHYEETDTEYEPDDVLLYAGSNVRMSMPSDPDYGFIGAALGTDIWVLPEVQQPDALFLGFGAEEIDPNDPTILAYSSSDSRVTSGPVKWIQISLLAVNGPGKFSVFDSGIFGGPRNWMATSDGIGSQDLFLIPVGSHGHVNWAFTEKGIYDVELQASLLFDSNNNGMVDQNDSRIYSSATTYHFGVETVPEPASFLALLGLSTLAVRRRRNL